MKYSIAAPGKIHIIRLEDREIVQDSIEKYAKKMNIRSAKVQLLGGIDKDSKIIVGPYVGRGESIKPMIHVLNEMHEALGTGTIFCNEEGKPKLHCHLSCGRGENTICGEIREGVIVWHVMEVIITELLNTKACRRRDIDVGFDLLMPENDFKS